MTHQAEHRAGRSATRPPLIALAATVVALALVATACGGGTTASPSSTSGPPSTSTPAPSPTQAPSPVPTSAPTPPDDLAVYAQIADQVVAERGLEAKQRIVPTVLSEAQVRERIKAQFEKENTPEQLAVAEETLKALNLLPRDADLGKLYVEMLGSQVAGFYDSRAKEMVVVSRSGKVGGTEKTTFAHEFTHALQDQHFGLEEIDVDAIGQGDRSLARLSLVEGDATLLMTRWLVAHLDPEEIGEILAGDPDSLAQLAAMPAILRETLLFPYQQGTVFATGLFAAGGWEAIDRAYGRLPASTEQVLHPARYEAGEKPVEVRLDAEALAKAMGAGWSGTPEDTLGEFQLSVWLRENGVTALDASAAAEGWGGDRLAYLRGPHGAYALVLDTAWDSPADAGEFAAAAGAAVRALPGAARMERGDAADRVLVLAASDAAALAKVAEAARGSSSGG